MSKKQIRIGVFETNSSSTHTLSIVKKDDYEKYKKGELLNTSYDEITLATKDELRNSGDYKEHLKFLEREDSDYEFEKYLKDETYRYSHLFDVYEVLEEDVPDSDYVAISIYGYD